LNGEAASLTDQEKTSILGGEVAMWGEFVTPENVDSRIWPRAAAVAERLWSPQDVTDVPSMYRRLDAVSAELDRRGLRVHGDSFPEPLKTLADIVEPATFGQRIRTHRYDQKTPLDGLVDRVPPESEVARQFAELVDRMELAQMRVWLMRWRDNRAPLEPASATLRRLGTIGLEALDYLDRNQRPPDAWVKNQEAFLETLKKPQGELRFAIAPSIAQLVAATASQP
jgi:hexosaminidase